MGADFSRGTDDSSLAGPLDAPLSHLRDEWRKLPLPRVDESQERQERQSDRGRIDKPKCRAPPPGVLLNPRWAQIRCRCGSQFDADFQPLERLASKPACPTPND